MRLQTTRHLWRSQREWGTFCLAPGEKVPISRGRAEAGAFLTIVTSVPRRLQPGFTSPGSEDVKLCIQSQLGIRFAAMAQFGLREAKTNLLFDLCRCAIRAGVSPRGLRGRVHTAEDFDDLPADTAEAFGAT